jgi:protein ImuA
MALAAPADALCHLRRAVADIDGSRAFSLTEGGGSLRLGLPAVDAALQGGLAFGALHELAPATPLQLGAATGFALAAAALTAAGQHVLWIQTDLGVLEAGTPYGPGLDLLGLAMDRLVILQVPRPLDALWALEEALKSGAVAAAIAELPEAGAAVDLTASRRLALAVRAGGGLGVLLRHRSCPLPTAAMTRWEVAAAPSMPDRFGGLGRTAFDLSLNRNRRGRCGRWIVCWDHDEHRFVPQALSLSVAATARDRSDHARPFARTG